MKRQTGNRFYMQAGYRRNDEFQFSFWPLDA